MPLKAARRLEILLRCLSAGSFDDRQLVSLVTHPVPFHPVHLGPGTTQFCHSCPRARVPRVKHELPKPGQKTQDEQHAKSNENICVKTNFLKTSQETKLQRNKLVQKRACNLPTKPLALPARTACPVSLE